MDIQEWVNSYIEWSRIGPCVELKADSTDGRRSALANNGIRLIRFGFFFPWAQVSYKEGGGDCGGCGGVCSLVAFCCSNAFATSFHSASIRSLARTILDWT